MITSVKFVSIPTRDQDKALAFWTEKVGFDLITDQPVGPGKRWIEIGVGKAETRLVLFTMDGQEDRIGTQFNGALACDDVEATYAQLSKRGVVFKSPPAKQPWGVFAIMLDADGNEFVLSSKN
ncbi:MAG TPA: glyoxalase [Parvularcula sp.]|nr:glyoxalase [Parvularcula sp.]HBS33425.1 glyoxalase [Parvularcula sp.]HBS34823.1 glyoxalase [Parvularcula sp.]